jgi:hypothetical protein
MESKTNSPSGQASQEEILKIHCKRRNKVMASFLRPRRGKKATAESQNIVLKRGEVFFEVPTGGVGTGIGKIKMGDGTTAYSSLPYFLEQKSIDVASSAITFTESSSTDNATLLSEIKSGATVKVLFGSVKKLLSNINSSVTSLNNDLANILNGTSTVSKASSATSAVYSSTANYAKSAGSASKATSATSATYSSTATYSNSVKSITGASGGTVSSNISIIKDGATESVYYKVSNGTRSGALLTNGNSLGLYDLANSKWLLKSDVNGNTTFSGTSDYATNSGSATKATSATSATNASTANYAKAVTWDNVTSKPTYYAASLATKATNADTATYATNSGSASKATSATSATYSATALYSNAVKTINGSIGGTASGNITVSKATTDSSQVRVTNSLRSGSLHVSGTGNLGIYDIDNSKWLIKSDTNGNADFSGTSDYAKAAGSATSATYASYAKNGTVTYKHSTYGNFVSTYHAVTFSNITYTVIGDYKFLKFNFKGNSTTVETGGALFGANNLSTVITKPKSFVSANIGPIDSGGFTASKNIAVYLTTDGALSFFTDTNKFTIGACQAIFIYT